MSTVDTPQPTTAVPAGLGRRLSTFLFRHPRARLAALLALPLGWLVIVYFGSLFVLLLAAFWDTDPFTAEIVHTFTLENFQRIIETPVYRDVAWRTIQMAVFVTIADIVLAFPIAYYMARVASVRTRNLLVVAVLLPLWANYLVKAYAWRTILSEGGIVNWALEPFGLSFDGYSTVGLWLVFTYLWLPFMILPIYAGLERIPSSLLEASADLGGRSFMTFRRVVLPLVVPGGRRRLDLHLLAHARRLHRTGAHHERAVHRHGDLQHPRSGAPDGCGVLDGPDRRRDLLPPRRPEAQGVRVPLMVESRLTRLLLRLGTGLTLAFIYGPLIVIGLYAFNRNVTQKWPIENYSTRGSRSRSTTRPSARRCCSRSSPRSGRRRSRSSSERSPRSRSRGTTSSGARSITFAVILPIALPGIVTGLALQATIVDVLGPFGVSFGLSTIIVGHATFCVVVVYNNVIARMRRTARRARRGVGRSGRGLLADVPVRDVPADAHGAAGRRPAGVRPLVRRGRRHDLHVGRASRRCRSGSSRPSPGRPSCRS